jgi:hypothetical protein
LVTREVGWRTLRQELVTREVGWRALRQELVTREVGWRTLRQELVTREVGWRTLGIMAGLQLHYVTNVMTSIMQSSTFLFYFVIHVYTTFTCLWCVYISQ